jgi:NTE family protein
VQLAHVCGEFALPDPQVEASELAARLARRSDREWTTEMFPRSGRARRPALASPRVVLRAFARPHRTPPELLMTGLLGEGPVSTRTIGRIIENVCGEGWPARRFWATATDLESGRRVAFGRADAPTTDLARAVRASCAIPAFFAPVRVRGRRFVDGGIRSVSNLDLVAGEGLDLVVCVNPLSPTPARTAAAPDGRLAGMVRRLEHGAWSRFGRRLALERRRVEERGTPVLVLQPSAADLEVMPRNWMAAGPRGAVARRAVETTLDAFRAPWTQRAANLLREATT